MSKVGVVKNGSIKEFLQLLFGFNAEESSGHSFETLDDVKPGRKIGVEELEELKESDKRVQHLTEKYRIEKFEKSQKSPKIKKSRTVKNIESENEIGREEEEQGQEMER